MLGLLDDLEFTAGDRDRAVQHGAARAGLSSDA